MTDLTSGRPACQCCTCDHEAHRSVDVDARCPHCGCYCPWPDPDETEGNPDACPCCRSDCSPDSRPVVHTDDLTYVVGRDPVVIDGEIVLPRWAIER